MVVHSRRDAQSTNGSSVRGNRGTESTSIAPTASRITGPRLAVAGRGEPGAAAAGSLEGSRALHLPEQDLARATVTRSPIALTVVDAEGIVVLWNPAAERLFGWVASEVMGQYLPIVDDCSRDEFNQFRDSALAGQEFTDVEVQRRHKDGHLVDVALSTVALHDPSGRAVSVLGAYQDIRGRKAAEAELVRQARVDDLTGLVNRRGLLDELRNARPGTKRQVVVIAIDLDHFKQVNDTVGHHIGDLLLKRVGQIFNARVRRSDTVARTGGDEFSIILESPTSREIANLVGESLMQLLEEPFEFEGHSVHIGGSVGIAVFPEDASDAATLRIAADRRMYGDKYAGRTEEPEIPEPRIQPLSIPAPDPEREAAAR